MRCHGKGYHAYRLLAAEISFVRFGDGCDGFRHRDRRRWQRGADLRGSSEESSLEAFIDLLRRRRRRTGLRSDAETSCSSSVLGLKATEFGRLERGLLLGLATGLFELQLLGYTVGLQEGFVSGLGQEGGLRSSLGLAATSEGPLRESLGGRLGSGTDRFGQLWSHP